MIPRLKYQKINIPTNNSAIEGTVLAKDKKALYVDASPLGLAIVRGYEFNAARNFIKDLNIGDKVIIKILELDNELGLIEASLKEASRDKIWNYLTDIKRNNETIVVRPTEANRGGLIIDLKGIQGFLPASQLSPKHYPEVDGGDKETILAKLKDLVNRDIEVKILDLDEETNKLIFSEKEVQHEAEKQKLVSNFQIGDVVECTITKIVPFGMFVKFNNPPIDGLIHISEIDYQLIANPADIYKEGEKIQAKIQSITNNKVSLSIKALKPDPWKDATEIYKIGKQYEGKILKTGTLGVLVEFEPGIYGFMKYNDVENKTKIDQPLEIGEKRNFTIKTIDPNTRRIALTL